MDQIIASPDGTISSTDAVNTTADLEKKMSITHADELLKKLVKDKWMSEVIIITTLFMSQIFLAEHRCSTNWGDWKSNFGF